MRKILLIIFICCCVNAFGQVANPQLEMLIYPKYIMGTTGARGEFGFGIPYVYRAKITGLTPFSTYRYENKVTNAYTSGSRYQYLLPAANVPPGTPNYNPGDYFMPPKSSAGNNETNGSFNDLNSYYGLLTADKDGTYTGWFIQETMKYNGISGMFLRIVLNEPSASPADIGKIAYTLHSPIDEPIYAVALAPRANTTSIQSGTAIRSTATQGAAKNIVLLYDNVEGLGRPIATTFLESDGVKGEIASTLLGQAPFYYNNVNEVNGAWGTMILNSDSKGIRRIEQRSVVDGSLIGYNTSADGTWPDGAHPGGTVATANVTIGSNGDGSLAIVIDGSKVTLAPVKDPQTVAFTNTFPTSFKVGDPDFTLSASSSSGLSAFEYNAAPSGILEITGNTVKIVGNGKVVITVTEPGNANIAADSETQEITVAGLEQAIMGLPETLTSTYGDENIVLTATGGASGNAIQYTVDDTEIAEIVDGNHIHPKKAGTVLIRANQPGTAIYAPATEITSTLTITKASLDVIAENKVKIRGAANPEATFTYGPFKNNDDSTSVTGNPVLTINATTNSPAGIYNIDIDVADLTSDKYIFNPVKGTLTVENKLEQVITFTDFPATVVYGNQPLLLNVSSTSTNEINYSSSNPQVAVLEKNAADQWTVKIIGTGNVDITASQSADGTYIAGTQVQHLLINKSPLKVIADDKAKLITEADPEFTAHYEGFVNGDGLTGLTGTLTFDKQAEGADFLIIPSGLSANNYTLTFINGKLSIGNTAFAAINKVYGDLPFNPAATNDTGEVPTYTVANADVAVVNNMGLIEIKGAGTTEITASFPSGAVATAGLTVAQKEIIVTPDAKTKVYAQPNPEFTLSYTGFVYGETEEVIFIKPQVSTLASLNSPVAKYLITATGANAQNYKFSYQPGVLTITKAVLNIIYNELPAVTYGDAAFTPVITANFAAVPVLSSDNLTVAIIENGRIKITGAGTANITASFASTGDYIGGTAVKTLTVSKRNLVVRADNKTRLYGQGNPVLTATYEGFVNGENLTAVAAPALLSTVATPLTAVGTYTVIGSAASALNYTFSYEAGILTIDKAMLTVTADNKTRAYGIQNPVFTFTYTGFANAEDASVLQNPALATTTADINTPAGSYPIVTSSASDENYNFNYINGVLTIASGSRTITLDPIAVKFIGDTDFTPSSTLSSGETPVFNSSDPAVATIVDNKIHIVGTGNVLITAAAPVNANYTNKPSFSQYMIVRKMAQVITFDNVPVLTSNGNSYTLKARSTSGLPLTFTVSNPGLLSLNGDVVKGLRIGKVQVTANQAGDSRYNAAQAVINEVEIIDASGNKVKVNPALSLNGDGVNEFLSIDGIKEFPINKVTIIDRNGLRVFEQEGYDNDQRVFIGKSKSGQRLPQGTYFCLIEYHEDSQVRSKTGYFIIKY